MKFPIFELAKVLSFQPGPKGDGKEGKAVKIVKSTWCEDGEKNQLALFLSNGYLVLRYSTNQLMPALRQIPWPSKDPIRGLSYDSRGTWLICVTKHSNVYIIPALALLDLDAQIEQLWTLNDVTLIKVSKKCGPPTSVVWWQTLLGEHIAIVGTRLGKVLFVDLLSRKAVYETEIKGCISQLQLVKGDSQTMTYLLITVKTGHYWKILLEKKDEHFWKTDEELGCLGYDQIDSSHMPISCILNQLTGLPEDTANCDQFVPVRFYQFPLSVQLQPQYAKGRHFITAYNRVKRTFEVYDSSLEHRPLFIYEVPKQADDVVLTDKLIICSMKQDTNVRLMFISNQMAETSPEQNQVFNQQAVIQDFKLTDAVLVSIHKRALPFYWFERQEERDGWRRDNTGDNIAISMHTVLDGCIVVTQHDVYECRPRVSPERYFLNLCLNQSDLSFSEQLGIMLGLDINGLYEDAARSKMEGGDFTQAMRLYKLSKCPHRKRVAIMAQHGRLSEVTAYLQQVLYNTSIDMTTAESKALADVALHCFAYMIEKKEGGPGMKQALRDFLLNNFSYNEQVAIDLLLDHYMMEQLFELAKARGPGMMIEVIKAFVARGFISLSRPSVESLVAKNMAIFLLRIGEGSFLRCMGESDLVQFMISQPRLAAEFTDTLRYHLGSYDITTLLQLARVFDPSSSLVQMYLHKAESGVRKRTSSVSSLSSLSSVMSEDTLQSGHQESFGFKAKQLIQFFFEVILQLHAKRDCSSLDPKYLATSPTQKKPVQLLSYPRGKTYSHLVEPVVIGCGHSHSALIRNGDLYTWGRTQDGRLGHGNIAADHIMYPPCKVETLHMLQIKVLSISCGAKHTIALTQQGVYGWGASQYGQVGIGDTVTRAQPMLIEALTSTPIISVVCGQYHSLARAADSRVYSWGWGVFGQLGHGSIEDVLTPTVIEGLSGLNVVQVQGGYAHTLILTAAGEIFGFGNNSYGQLGEGKTFKITSPKRLDGLTEPVAIIASRYFCSFALTNQNQLFTFGCSPLHVKQNMQLAKVDRAQHDPDFYLYPYVVNIEGVEGKIVQMSAGSTHIAVLTAEGRVYSWGKNYDGQLGLGSNREYPSPVLVTALKDRAIKLISCGASHTMALDKDGNVFTFGRNEFAQLGISDQAGLENTRNIQNMGSQPNPTLLKWVPASTSLIGDQHKRRGSDDFWLSDSSIDGEEMGSVGNIPDLSSLTEPEYDVHVITTVVQHLGEYCSLTKLVRQCWVEKLWGIVGDIYEALHLYAQSIQFKLRELRDHRDQFDDKTVIQEAALEILEKFLSNMDQSPGSQRHPTLKEPMVRDVFLFWGDLELPFSDLEAILDTYLELLAVPVCLVMTSPPPETDVPQDQCQVIKNLSVRFIIKVISHVICLIKTGDMPSDVMTRLGLESTDQRQINPAHQQKLWQQILRNLREDVDKMAFITMTTNDAKIITEQMEEYGDKYAVVFTCGHHFPRKHFMEHVLPRFTANFVGSLTSLQQTARLLTQYYTSMKTLPMACPSCVQEHIVQTI